MGLDMYLSRAKKLAPNITPKDLSIISSYLTYKNRDEKYADSSLDDWCGFDEAEVPKDLVSLYEAEYKTSYCCWDDEQKYPFSSIFEEVGYWRKANQIHNWFVNNIQGGVDNCEGYEVTKEQLETLLNICEKISNEAIMVASDKVINGYKGTPNGWEPNYESGEVMANPEIALELLPPAKGCFFGSTEIDEYYMMDINEAIDILREVLDTTDFSREMVIYQASW